ncbi:MAG: ATP-binding protein [Candidatus Dormibacteria bacterium]
MSAAQPVPRRLLASFTIASQEGGERLALRRVAKALPQRLLSGERQQRLQTAVAEATMNAIEHGNQGVARVPVHIEVFESPGEVVVSISDQGGAAAQASPEEPDLELKLAGQQTPRGWGLFLIRHMVDAMDITTEGHRHTVWLTMRTGAEEVKENS